MQKKLFRHHFGAKKTFLLKKLCGCLFAVTLLTGNLKAQNNNNIYQQTIAIGFQEEALNSALLAIEKQSGFRLVFPSELVKSAPVVNFPKEERTIAATLELMLKGTRLLFKQSDGTIVLFLEEEKPAQTTSRQPSVTGRIVDAGTGEAIPYAVITLKGSSRTYATTDLEGKFTITLDNAATDILVVNLMGYDKVEVPVNNRNVITIELKVDAISLNAAKVVATGYQVIAREKVTGAVNTITAEELSIRYTPNLLDNFEGKVAGLMVYDGGMQIRGNSSIRVDRTPLLVVDGLPIEGVIEDLNPYDIESVTILKDAAAAAIYGARASNGIIVVTTKKARKEGKVDVVVSADFTLYEKPNVDYHDNFYMDARDQVAFEMRNWEIDFFGNPAWVPGRIRQAESIFTAGSGNWTPVRYAYYQLAAEVITRDQFNSLMETYSNNNFAKEYADHILRNRLLQQYNVSIRNRTEKFSSNFVLNYRHDNTGTIKTFNDRFSAFYKGSYDMTTWFSLNFGTEVAFQNEQQCNQSDATSPFKVPPYMRLLNDDGSYNYYGGAISDIYHIQWKDEPGLRFNGFNPLEEIQNQYDQTRAKRLNTRLQGELLFHIVEGLSFSTQFVYEADRRNQSIYSQEDSYLIRMMRNAYTTKTGDIYSYLIPEHGGMLTTQNTCSDNWTARGQLNFNRTFKGRHTIDFLSGIEFRDTYSKGTKGLMLGYDDQLQSHATITVNFPALQQISYAPFYGSTYNARTNFYNKYFAPTSATGVNPIREQHHRYGSAYANLTYTFDNRYNLFGSYRSDYADIYGLDSKFRGKPLWSVGASWNINREDFLKNLASIEMLKFRTSYGITGNIYQGATSYLTATTGTINTYTLQPIAVISSPANPELKWEQSATFNLGLDFGLLQNRLRGSVDWYNKIGTDIFALKLLDDSKGFASMSMNAASLRNNGIEIALAAEWFRPVRMGAFSWTTSTTFAYNKNEITEVDTPAVTAEELIETPLKKGYPVTALFSLPFAGQLGPTGTVYLKWSNGVAKTAIVDESPDVTVFSGQTDPKYVLGMENLFRFHNFNLNVMLVYYGGHHLRMRQISNSLYNNIPKNRPIDIAYLDSWTPENTETIIPGYGVYGGDGGRDFAGDEYLDIFVHSGAFIKIRNIVLAYDLPQSLISKLGLNRASVRFQIDNPRPLYIANRFGIDPETGGVRKQTSYIFGLNFNF